MTQSIVSSRLTSPRNSKGNTGSGAPNKRGVGKIRNFQSISRRISDTVQAKTKVTINLLTTNRKSHIRSRLIPNSMTLDDLELL